MGPRRIESKSKTAMPLKTTPVRFVPPGPVNVGVPLVLIVYVPPAVGNAPSEAKSSGFSGPARARPAPPSHRPTTNAETTNGPETILKIAILIGRLPIEVHAMSHG